MAVYTEVGFEQADAFVRGLGRGRVTALQGIGAGIENTNYFVSSDARRMGAYAVRAPVRRASCLSTCS
jgi:hypothetical protein